MTKGRQKRLERQGREGRKREKERKGGRVLRGRQPGRGQKGQRKCPRDRERDRMGMRTHTRKEFFHLLLYVHVD